MNQVLDHGLLAAQYAHRQFQRFTSWHHLFHTVPSETSSMMDFPFLCAKNMKDFRGLNASKDE
jgi:hypothetical protein